MRSLVILTLFLLTSCGMPEAFSPTYDESYCVPTQSLTEILEIPTDAPASDSTACCADKGGVVACCYGGVYTCVDGSSGVGCGCPSR